MNSENSAVDEGAAHGFRPLRIIVVVTLEYVGEKEKLEHEEGNEQLYQYQHPQLTAHSHRLETVDIEPHHPS